MKKKKLFLYIHQCILKGGVEKVFYNLLNNLPQDEYEITVLSHIAYLSHDIHDELYPKNVRRRWLYYDEFSPSGLPRLLQRIHNFIMPRFYPLFLQFRHFDTAIAAQEGMYAKFILEHVKSDNKLLWIHNDMSLCHWTGKHFGSHKEEVSCYQQFDKVICVSQSVADSMNAVFGHMDNLHVCYNPIDTSEIDRNADSFSVPRDEVPLFVSVGRLVDQKGFDRLLRVCRRLNECGYQYRVLILGDGEKRAELEREIQKGGLDNVSLLGNQPNPFPYMKSADWVICTSRHEGFNMVLHEAVWCGTPIITTRNAGAAELLGDNQYGIITDNDEEAFFDTMCQVLEQPDLLRHYQDAVLQRREFIDLSGRIEAIRKEL